MNISKEEFTMQKIITFTDDCMNFNATYLSYQTKDRYFRSIGKPYFIYKVNLMCNGPYQYQKITPELADVKAKDLYNCEYHVYDTFNDYGDIFYLNSTNISNDSQEIYNFFHNEKSIRIDPNLINLIDPHRDDEVTIIQVPDGIDWKIYSYIGDDGYMEERVQTPHYTFDENGDMEDDGL